MLVISPAKPDVLEVLVDALGLPLPARLARYQMKQRHPGLTQGGEPAHERAFGIIGAWALQGG
jgi:hypothetical protein